MCAVAGNTTSIRIKELRCPTFFDPATKEVSQGKTSGWENRMGPYDTRKEAENAIEIAQARNDAADAADKEDDWK